MSEHGVIRGIGLAVLVAGWLVSIAIVLHTARDLVALLPLFLMIGATVVVFRTSYVPALKKSVEEIAELTEDIEESIITNDLQTIPDNVIKANELQPLVDALNRLIEFQQDRYASEREFTANASHELRTPLAGIRLQAQLAMMAASDEQRDQALRNILKAVDRGTRLVEQLLILSRLTADKIELEQSPFFIDEAFAAVDDDLGEFAKEKNTQLSFSVDGNLDMHAHRDSVEILVNNLVRNALIYSPADSLITITAAASGDDVLFEVADDGPGIPPELRDTVMERFRKAVDGTKTGTGLGLAIVKRIAELHQATVVLSETPGGGLTVTVRFPTPQVAVAA